MFELKIATQYFFDKAAVKNAVDDGTRRALAKGGAAVRREARGSLRKRKGPAPPGEPPHSHKGHLKRFLFFAWDPNTKSVVVGPAKLGTGKAPPLLEYGGTTIITRRKRRIPAHYPARPFMAPALEKTRPQLPEFWKDAIR